MQRAVPRTAAGPAALEVPPSRFPFRRSVRPTTPAAPKTAPNTSPSTTNTGGALPLPSPTSANAATAMCAWPPSRRRGERTRHRVLQFTNISGRPCFLQGYPGAALLDASGHVLADAQRTLDGYFGGNLIAATDPGLTAPPRVTLNPGRDAIAELEWENTGSAAGGCLIRQSPALRITPPDSPRPATLPGLSDVCAGFEIGPVLKDNAAG